MLKTLMKKKENNFSNLKQGLHTKNELNSQTKPSTF